MKKKYTHLTQEEREEDDQKVILFLKLVKQE